MRARLSSIYRPTIRAYATVIQDVMQAIPKPKPTHAELTVSAPRDPSLHRVTISAISQPNSTIRTVRLKPEPGQEPIKFLPGQWLDVHLPGVRQVGGFSITSTPKDAEEQDGQIHLAIQHSLKNPPAVWFWRPIEEVRQSKVDIRVGGNFVWPPPNIDPQSISKLVFVAGGVGINPLISILTHLHQHPSLLPRHLTFLYTHRQPTHRSATTSDPTSSIEPVLFLNRLRSLFASPPFSSPTAPSNSSSDRSKNKNCRFSLFLTPPPPTLSSDDSTVLDLGDEPFQDAGVDVIPRRIAAEDLTAAVGARVEERKGVVAYVCGPPGMTDWAVETLRGVEGVRGERVICEKWW